MGDSYLICAQLPVLPHILCGFCIAICCVGREGWRESGREGERERGRAGDHSDYLVTLIDSVSSQFHPLHLRAC